MDDDDGSKHFLMSKRNGFSSGKRPAMSEEFEEAEVWEAMHDDPEPRKSSSRTKKGNKSSDFFSSSGKNKAPWSKSKHEASAVHHHHHGGQPQSPVPQPTPNWSHNLSQRPSSNHALWSSNVGDQQDENELEETEDMIPPHEWIARRLARTQISSSSVCEGAGRTLKGRDLTRVRDAVLTKTGFIEPQQ